MDYLKQFLSFLAVFSVILACSKKDSLPPLTPAQARTIAEPCDKLTQARIEEPVPNIYVAIGYALSNTILIKTPAGNVIVDASTSPAKAEIIKRDLLAKAPGKILALIYTHSHIDHVGGASVWVDHDTPIWASTAFKSNFLAQYGLFQQSEEQRGGRQYGLRASNDLLPCTSIGPAPDMEAMLKTGARLPTRTFSGSQSLDFGGVRLELSEAHGETPDEIMIWLPRSKTLLSGDNIYKAFPNLYTIRGTTPRPVNDWIDSLDRMRRLEPEVVIPSHTEPIVGKEHVQETLTAYRDGIQWLRDATARGANAGMSATELAETVRLPPHLAKHPYLQETYGQVDWSVRAIYSDNLGWFGGEPEALYPLPHREAARREVALMGGAQAVFDAASGALASGDSRWAIHLLSKLNTCPDLPGDLAQKVKERLSEALAKLAAQTANTNGRGYLASVAAELKNDDPPFHGKPEPDIAFVRDLPAPVFLKRFGTRLKAEDTLDVLQSIKLTLADMGQSYTITIRRGIAEVSEGMPPPNTPSPLAEVKIDSMVWKQLLLKELSLPKLLLQQKIKVDGSWLGLVHFLSYFSID